jgi:hypothetical protein
VIRRHPPEKRIAKFRELLRENLSSKEFETEKERLKQESREANAKAE